MTREERKYFVTKLQNMFSAWADAHDTDSVVGSAKIESFADKYMQTITGQQDVPQGLFRIFLCELSQIIARIEVSSGSADLADRIDELNDKIGLMDFNEDTITDAIKSLKELSNRFDTQFDEVNESVDVTNKEIKELDSSVQGLQSAVSSNTDAISNKADKVEVVEVVYHPDDGILYIEPNKMYHITMHEEVVSANAFYLEVELEEFIDTELHHYMFKFDVPTEAISERTLVMHTSITWYGGNEPEWQAGKTYEISIIDGLAMWAEFDTPTTTE